MPAYRRFIAITAAAAGAVAVGSLSVAPEFQRPSGALPLTIGLGAFAAAVLSRWDRACVLSPHRRVLREHRPLLGAYVALFAVLPFTVLLRDMFVTAWPVLLVLAAGAFSCRLLSVVVTFGTELCRTELPRPTIPDATVAPADTGLAWPTAVALLVLGSTLRAVGFFMHTVRREWLS
jgi:hypothetical protein